MQLKEATVEMMQQPTYQQQPQQPQQPKRPATQQILHAVSQLF